jgi:large conductance mechanosensitive channel
MLSDFKAFIAKGNVMDLAVAVIIGGAFSKIVTSLTDDLIMPVVGAIFGGLDFSDKYLVLTGDVEPGTSLEAAREAGANVLAFGSFISVVINFLILAFIIFLLVKYTKRVMAEFEAKPPEEKPAGPTELDILKEIRDELKKPG